MRDCAASSHQQYAVRVCSHATLRNAIMNAHTPALLSYPPRFPSTTSPAPLLLQLPHHPLPDLSVNHTPNTKRRHDPAYPRERALAPVHHHLTNPALRTPYPRLRPIVQIQAQQMQRCAHELDRRGGHKLRHARAAHVLGHLLAHLLLQLGRKQGRQVERGEDGEAVAHSEEGEGGERDGAFGPGRAEELGEFVVFVEA